MSYELNPKKYTDDLQKQKYGGTPKQEQRQQETQNAPKINREAGKSDMPHEGIFFFNLP